MVGLKESFTTKLGPLPIGVWVGVPAVLFVTYKWFQHKSGGGSSEGEPVPIGVATDIGDSADFSNGYGNAAGSYFGSSGSTATNSDPGLIAETNDDWAMQAQNFLIARGVNPQDAVRAIRAYIYGDSDTLNTTQMGALNLALQQFRSPPEPSGIRLPRLEDTPVVTPPTPPTTVSPVVQGSPNVPTTTPPPIPRTGTHWETRNGTWVLFDNFTGQQTS